MSVSLCLQKGNTQFYFMLFFNAVVVAYVFFLKNCVSQNLYVNMPSVPVKEEIQPATLDKLWRMVLLAIEQREKSLQDDLKRCEKLRPTAEATCRSVLIIDGRLKHLKDQMKQVRLRFEHDWSIAWLSHRLIDSLVGWLIDWLID